MHFLVENQVFSGFKYRISSATERTRIRGADQAAAPELPRVGGAATEVAAPNMENLASYLKAIAGCLPAAN